MSSQKQSPLPTPTPLEYKRGEGFTSKYANNVFLESSAWDLKLVFGQVDANAGPNAVVQHSAITLPWAQVKVLAYLMQFHLLGHEGVNGRVVVPRSVVQPVPEHIPKAVENIPNAESTWAEMLGLYERFIAANPEAVIQK
jgi:hypothetical protein